MRARSLACFLLALPLAGCRAERHLVFVSEPPGAHVRLDGKVVGRTPLDLRFEHYGTRRISIYRSGYRSHDEVIEVETPWFFVFPLDYVSEILLPFGWEDIHRFEVVLEPQTGEVTEGDMESVLGRAERLRRGGPAGPDALEIEQEQAANADAPAVEP